jgi:hypothetical protein
MKVKLVYKTAENKYFSTIDRITIKEAKILSNKLLKENTDIVEIYLKHFDGWHDRRVKTLFLKKIVSD